jgi:hypothetical protein
VGVRHALFPDHRHLALSFSEAVDSPTLFPAAGRIVGLIAGPSGRLPVTDYRVRPLGLVRLLPAGRSLAKLGPDTPVKSDLRVWTVSRKVGSPFWEDVGLAPRV